MVTIVQSRFAGLKIDDDDEVKTKHCKQPEPAVAKTKKKSQNINLVKKNEPTKKKNKQTPPSAQPQSVTINASNAGGGKKKKNTDSNRVEQQQQWEQWKEKDEQLINGNYEEDLKTALLMSKVDFEEKKDFYKQLKIQTAIINSTSTDSVKSNNSSKKNNKKSKSMSLDQFNEMVSNGHIEEKEVIEETLTEVEDQIAPGDPQFFDRVVEEAQIEINKEYNLKDTLKNRDQITEEILTRIQYTDVIEKKDTEIDSLKTEIDKLKQELIKVKLRNKKLCNILGHGEMKEKAELLVEVEKLRSVQDELTKEVESLNTILQQERSARPDARNKEKKKKAVRFDESSEKH